MSYKIEIQKSTEKELRALTGSLQVRIFKAIDNLCLEPRPNGCKKLSGAKNAYRIRIGDFRIVYEIFDGVLVVVVIRIAHRREVYH